MLNGEYVAGSKSQVQPVKLRHVQLSIPKIVLRHKLSKIKNYLFIIELHSGMGVITGTGQQLGFGFQQTYVKFMVK